jgi:16S rRNA (uracil1498-N3)-methyltransferase
MFAPIKRPRMEWLVEKATELGASFLAPVVTRHTDISQVNVERLSAIATEAAEQCERLSVPVVCDPVPLTGLLAGLAQGPMPLLACLETGAARPLAQVAAELRPGPVAFVVGPEGGFATKELDELLAHPLVVGVGLGPRVLRAETAALAALACWQALRGDWRDDAGDDARPPFRGPAS